MSDQITFNYNHCSPEELSKDVTFDETVFGQILQECFETNQTVTSIDVTFETNLSQATDKYTCSINIHTVGKTHYVKESGEDSFSKIVTQACHKAVKIVRDQKADVVHEGLNSEE